jgi:Mg-chelatase subunit ChlI
LRASSVESRFEAMHAGALTALVGRDEESKLLLQCWARAKTGEGPAVLISGEAGIGKSRLTAALIESLAAEPHTRLRYFCSPQHTDSAFYSINGQMERAAGFLQSTTLIRVICVPSARGILSSPALRARAKHRATYPAQREASRTAC